MSEVHSNQHAPMQGVAAYRQDVGSATRLNPEAEAALTALADQEPPA